MIKFSQLDYHEVLKEEVWEEYDKRMEFFYLNEIVPLNVNIFLCEKIISFPFGLLFFRQEEYMFFRTVISNFQQVNLLTIARIAADQASRKEPNTLPSFKNWVLENVRTEYKDEFQKTIKDIRFDKKTKKLLERVTSLRNGRLAHLDREYDNFAQDVLDFEETKHLRDILNSLLNVLSFDVGRKMLPVNYLSHVDYPKGIDNRCDIERFLDAFAQESSLIHAPEKNQYFWDDYRKNLSQDDIDIINKYRGKCGLPLI